jgi:hypothetical protein
MSVSVWSHDRMKQHKETSKRIYELRKEMDDLMRKAREREYTQRLAYFARIEREFVLKPDHVKLLKRGYWVLVEDTDLACVAMSGKYPFGGGGWYEDVWEILGWPVTYGPDGADHEWYVKAQDIMAELPHAMKAILSVTDPDDIVSRAKGE